MGVNQTSFKKGQSGNPSGRPLKGHSITEWFREMLDSDPEVRERLGRSILNKALNGDIAAILRPSEVCGNHFKPIILGWSG